PAARALSIGCCQSDRTFHRPFVDRSVASGLASRRSPEGGRMNARNAVLPVVAWIFCAAGVAVASCDPSTEPDRSDVATARAAIAAACDCATAASHGDYVRCAAAQAG